MSAADKPTCSRIQRLGRQLLMSATGGNTRHRQRKWGLAAPFANTHMPGRLLPICRPARLRQHILVGLALRPLVLEPHRQLLAQPVQSRALAGQ